jgi:hypothetical protein
VDEADGLHDLVSAYEANGVDGAELLAAAGGLEHLGHELEAVAGVDFEVATGEIFGLLGPNGAGKTTTVEILEGYRQRSDGIVSVLGFDPQQRPRALREAASLWRQLREQRGIEGRDSLWAHPDLLPDADDLTDPGAFLAGEPWAGFNVDDT